MVAGRITYVAFQVISHALWCCCYRKQGNNSGKKNSTNNYNEKESELSYLLNADSDVIDNINKSSKTKRIEELLENGFKDDEICEKLQLGKGEVQLVRELLKKQKK